MKYEKAEAERIWFSNEDVIQASDTRTEVEIGNSGASGGGGGASITDDDGPMW